MHIKIINDKAVEGVVCVYVLKVFFVRWCSRGVQGSKFDPVSVSVINRIRILNRFRFRLLTVFLIFRVSVFYRLRLTGKKGFVFFPVKDNRKKNKNGSGFVFFPDFWGKKRQKMVKKWSKSEKKLVQNRIISISFFYRIRVTLKKRFRFFTG